MTCDPIFIVGTMRSGSTLLRLVLDSHPDLAIGTETGFMQAVRQIESVPGFIYGDRWYERYGLTLDDLRGRIRDLYDGVFGEHARREGKQRWGEKTPHHVWHLAEMQAVFPDARFVAIVRHAGAMATSLHRWRNEFSDHVDEWLSVNHEILRRAPDLGDRLALIRYEDLLTHPHDVLGELLAFLGLPWSDDVLRHHEVQDRRGNHDPVEGGTLPTDPLDPSRAWRWTAQLDGETIAELERRAGPTLRWLGYDPAGSTPAPAFDGRYLTTGALLAGDLAARPLDLVPAREPQSARDVETALADARRELVTIQRQRSVRYARGLSALARARSRSDLRAAWAALRGRPALDDTRRSGA